MERQGGFLFPPFQGLINFLLRQVRQRKTNISCSFCSNFFSFVLIGGKIQTGQKTSGLLYLCTAKRKRTFGPLPAPTEFSLIVKFGRRTITEMFGSNAVLWFLNQVFLFYYTFIIPHKLQPLFLSGAQFLPYILQVLYLMLGLVSLFLCCHQ
jgi:hypothetical protein